MSSISALQVSGTSQVQVAKPQDATDAQTLSSAGTNGYSADNTAATSLSSTNSAATTAAALYPSPQLRIDPLVDRVILQFRDATTGQQTYQLPTKQQLAAYENSQATDRTAFLKTTDTPPISQPVAESQAGADQSSTGSDTSSGGNGGQQSFQQNA